MKSQEDFMEELKKRFPNNNIEILSYEGASKPIKYKCLQCGLIYKKSRANHIYENKTLCQKCYTVRDSSIRNKFINYLNKRKDLEIIKMCEATSEKVEIKCLKCNQNFKVEMSNFIVNESHSCPHCGKNGSPINKKEMYRRMKENGKEDYEIVQYKNATRSAMFKHKKCGFIFTQLPVNFLKGRGCPKCFKNISKGELTIMNFLKENNISFIYQKNFLDLPRKRYDFYLPELNTLIEYQGRQHYEPCTYFGGEETFILQQKRDEEKREYAKSNNYKLIEIPYDQDIYNYLIPLKGSTTIS